MRLSELLVSGRPPKLVTAHLANRAITWSEFSGRVRDLSAALAARPEQSWLLACAEPFDFAVALFAVWHAGRRALLPPSLQAGAIAEVRAPADGLLAEPDTWPTAAADAAPPHVLAPLDPGKTGLDLYTSGSTGHPKRIGKSLAQLEAEVASLERQWGDARLPVLATVPHHHIYGLLFRLLWPLAAGRPFDNETCAAPELLLARLEKLGPAWIVSSPSQLARMPELIPLTALAGCARRIFSSGGPLAEASARQFHVALGEAPLEVLGSTETGGIAWRRQNNDDAWTPFPEIKIAIGEDAALTLVSPFLPAAAPYVSDEAAELLPSGRFRLLGRRDRIVKIEEKRLSLPDMEARLATHPWVSQAAVAVLAGRRQFLGAALVLADAGRDALRDQGRATIARTLRDYLAHWFDPVLLPRRWRYPDTLPYDERGKLPAAALAHLFEVEARVEY